MRVLGASLNQRTPGNVIKVGKRKYDRLYFKMNRDQLLEKSRIHRRQTIETYSKYNKQYREINYIQLKTKARKRIESEISCMIRNDCPARHNKIKKTS